MKITKWYLTVYLFFIQFYSYSQVNKIANFRVFDSSTMQPIESGKIILSVDQDTIASKTFKNGSFSFSCERHLRNKSILTIISPSYDTLHIKFDSTWCISDTINIIRLKQYFKALQEIVVTSSLIRQDIDKITYNVAGDPDSKSLTLLDFIPRLPFVSLSPDDNPLFKGKSNFIVLLNGRRSSMFLSKTLREALKAISAATISKIEVIIDPPEKYDNEGYIGVVNIITFKNPSNGYNAAFNSSVGTFISGINGSLNFKKNKLGLTFEGGINTESTPYNSIYSETANSNLKIIQKGEKKNTGVPKHSNVLLSYELDSMNLLTLDLGAYTSNLKYLENTSALAKFHNSNSVSTYFFNYNQHKIDDEYSLNLNYQKNFKNKREKILTISYLLNKHKAQNIISNSFEQRLNFDHNNFSQSSTSQQLNEAFQLDYVLPIEKIKIESGAKYIHRTISSSFSSNIFDPITGRSIIDTLNTGILNYNLSILGFYNSYLLKLKSYSFRAGFRIENTRLTGDLEFGRSMFEQQYTSFLPSLKILYKSKQNNIYSIGYKRQIQRPGVSLLNPFISLTAPGFGNSGNPDLKPVLINNINFEFSKFKKISVTLDLSYSFSKNTIQGITTNHGDTLILTTFENIGRYNRFGIENSIEIPFSEKFDISVNGSMYYVNIESKNTFGYLNSNGFEGFVYGYLTYRIKKNRFVVNAGYYGPTVNIQSRSNSYFYSSFGISRQILNSKGNISFRVANPFQAYRNLSMLVNNAELVQYVEQKNLFRGFYLSFNYRFGRLEKDVKRNKRSLQIDDSAKETGKLQ